jgi:hypothetical protein
MIFCKDCCHYKSVNLGYDGDACFLGSDTYVDYVYGKTYLRNKDYYMKCRDKNYDGTCKDFQPGFWDDVYILRSNFKKKEGS